MRRFPRSLAVLIPVLCLLQVQTSRADTDRPARTLEHRGVTLTLNGYGEREHWWTDIYRAALYVSERSSDPAFIQNRSVAKAISIRVLYGDIPDTMPADWREIFVDELNRELFGRLKRAFRKLEQNDLLTYVPETGTEIHVNGEKLLVDPGYDLMAALVDQWVGATPVSKNLRRLLLNEPL